MSKKSETVSATGTEYIKYYESGDLLKHKIINKDEIIQHQQKKIAIKNVIDDPFYPDDAILSLFSAVVYPKDLKESFDNALEEIKKKDKGDGSVIQYINKIQESNEWRLYGWAENEKDGYFGAAFWNSRFSQLVISHQGTKSTKAKLTDLEGIAKLKYTSQIHSACTFTTLILEGLDRSKIHVSITGHSLGGWLGQITTFAMEYLTLKNKKFTKVKGKNSKGSIHCVAIDSPGCHEMLRIIAGHYYPKYEKEALTMISALDITIYFNEPNVVNCCNSHRGISRLLQIYDPSNIISQLPREESSKFFDKILNYKFMFKSHKWFYFIYLLTTSKDIEIKRVLNWPSFHLPEGDKKTTTKTELSFWGAVPTVFKAMKPSFTLWSKENELANYYQKNKESANTVTEDTTQEEIGGIDNQYKVEPYDKYCRNAAIFTDEEKIFLKYWQQVYDRKIAVKKLKNIQKLLEKNELENFENFLPKFEIKLDENKNEIIFGSSSGNHEDLEKIIRRVKQLNAADSKAWLSMKKDIYEHYILAYKSLSNRYQKKLPVYDVEFEDTIKLEEFLDSNEKFLCLATNRDTKDEVFRVRFILQELQTKESEACYLGLAEFKELQNQVDVEKIYGDDTCSVDKILVIDCKVKRNEGDDNSFEDFIKMVLSSKNDKKVILIGNNDNKWLEDILKGSEIQKQNVAYSFLDFKEDTRNAFLNKEVATLWHKQIKMSQFLNSNEQLTKNETDLLSQPDILDFLLMDDPDLSELSSSHVTNFDNMRILTTDLQQNIDLNQFFSFLRKDPSELEQIYAKPVKFMLSGVSKLKLEKIFKSKINLDRVTFFDYDSGEFEKFCRANMDSRIYWIHFSKDNVNQVELWKLFDSDFHMERTMYRQDVIDTTMLSQIFNKCSDNCTFIFSNINREDLIAALEILYPDNINWIEDEGDSEEDSSRSTRNNSASSKHLVRMNSAHISSARNISVACVSDEQKGLKLLKDISKFKKTPVHLINAEGNGKKFTWTQSTGSLQTIQDILKTDRTIISPKVFSTFEGKTTLIVGESGTGKSTLLMKMAQRLESSWVLWVNLVNFRKKVDITEGITNIDDVINFFSTCNENSKSNFYKALLKFSLVHKSGIPVVIFFDGFDEINTDVQEKILDLVQFLKQNTYSTIFISSKIWAQNLLEDKLHLLSAKIQDMKEYQEKKFIKYFWLGAFVIDKDHQWLQKKANELYEGCQTIGLQRTVRPSEEFEAQYLWDVDKAHFRVHQLVIMKLINLLEVFYKSNKLYPRNSLSQEGVEFLQFSESCIEEYELKFFVSVMNTIWSLDGKKFFNHRKYLDNKYNNFQNDKESEEKLLIGTCIKLFKVIEKYDPYIAASKEINDDILAVPLHLRMIGEILQQENNYVTVENISKNLVTNIFELYNQFIKRKFKIFRNEKLQKTKKKKEQKTHCWRNSIA